MMANFDRPLGSNEYEYADYVAAGGALIPATDWTRYVEDAWRILRDVTQGACDEATDAAILATLTDALFRVADALYDEGVTAESLGSYSVTYAKAKASATQIAKVALQGTGLTYTGIMYY